MIAIATRGKRTIVTTVASVWVHVSGMGSTAPARTAQTVETETE
jgi:hypothetical protein